MKEIFEMQYKLNEYTLQKIGYNYSEIINGGNNELIKQWIRNYKDAYSAEYIELIKEVKDNNFNSQNAYVEIIDLLHFIVSLSHMVDINYNEIDILFNQMLVKSKNNVLDDNSILQLFNNNIIETFVCLDDILNSINYKWWKINQVFKIQDCKNNILSLWKVYIRLCNIFMLDLPQIKFIYIQKNKINYDRQNNNYGLYPKDESDNKSIIIGE